MKSIWTSKTFWVNVITGVVGILGVLAGNDLIKEHPQIAAGILSAVSALNVVLRIVTTQPVKLRNA